MNKFERIMADETTSAEQKLMALTRQSMYENASNDFAACFSRVCMAEPELHKEYLLSNGTNRG